MADMQLEQAVRNAIEVEIQASRFYRGLLAKASDAEARGLLERLMADEETHAHQIEGWAQRLAAGELAQTGSCACHLVETAPDWSSVDEITFREAVEIAIEAEIHASLYYDAMADSVGEGPLREFFASMMQVEEEHARRLDGLLVPGPG